MSEFHDILRGFEALASAYSDSESTAGRESGYVANGAAAAMKEVMRREIDDYQDWSNETIRQRLSRVAKALLDAIEVSES